MLATGLVETVMGGHDRGGGCLLVGAQSTKGTVKPLFHQFIAYLKLYNWSTAPYQRLCLLAPLEEHVSIACSYPYPYPYPYTISGFNPGPAALHFTPQSALMWAYC